MLELYNHDMSVCAAKVRFALAEKGLNYESHMINLLAREHKTPEYLALNPNGVVPTLVHDGHIIYESTIINEYIDDNFPDRPLKPADALGKARMRKWTQQLDTAIHAATSVVSTCIAFRDLHLAKPTKELELHFRDQPGADPMKVERHNDNIRNGLESKYFPHAVMRFEQLLTDMEEDLRDNGPWLAGSIFSLADIGYASYIRRLEHLQMSKMWRDRHHITDWYHRLQERDGFRIGIFDWDNKGYIKNMTIKGTAAWPQVNEIIAAGK